jgi:two-component system CheB/CheR fusion protein
MADGPDSASKIKSENLFPVVGIGASAGGLDAFKRLLKAIPQHSGMAYILVQHLDPAHDSILAELLQKVTRIPVKEITDNVFVQPDNVYIIPSNKLLTANDGVLQLSSRLPHQKYLPIDVFFHSLAEVHQSHAIGVVLSGTQCDGTLGLKAIKDHGGITFAQDPVTAAYDSMPQNAVDAGVVDFILPPEQIPVRLQQINTIMQPQPAANDSDDLKLQEKGFKQILNLLYKRKGADFSSYKQTTIRRRIKRRISLSMMAGMAEYLAFITDNKNEQDILYQDLLIPVTGFFRDAKVFEAICETVLTVLLKNRDGSEPLRIWIAGCSTGEEAYSLIMCMHDFFAALPTPAIPIQVFATDISEPAIAKARSGKYKKNEMTGLSAQQIKNFFTLNDGLYRLNKDIRDCCVFAFHNYLKDPPFARMDLVSCRNSLIYLEPVLQKKALTTFHYALKDKGFLLLGKSETISQSADLFTTVDKTNKIYSRKPVRGRFLQAISEKKNMIVPDAASGGNQEGTQKIDYQKNADEILLARYTPAGVIVNSELDIVQFRGSTGAWLEPPPGKPSLNILKMAREGLAFELRNAFRKVKASKQTLVKENIPMANDQVASFEVVPLLQTQELHYLVLFKNSNPRPDEKQNSSEKATGAKKQNREMIRIRKLQQELAQAREDMRSITEDQEASNEELQSANEELLSGSEELQSLNEELETSKEEIQTSNEELIVVNQELYDRNEQLNLSRLYAESIVTTIGEPIIILNKNLRVKTANRAFYQLFQTTIAATEGALFFELGTKQWYVPGLQEALMDVILNNRPINGFEISAKFPGIGHRIMLINATAMIRDNMEEHFILLAIEDVTEKRRIEQELKLATEQLEKKILERTASLKEANLELHNSNKNLEQFAYIASHDLQEPLRKIRTFSSSLQDLYQGKLPPQANELITKISDSAERMATLIKDVLNFSRMLNNDIGFEKTDLNSVLKNVLQDFDLLITEKKAEVNWQNLPVIEAIPLQMNQLLYNIISNAIKFSKPGVAPVVTITSHQLTPKEVVTYKLFDETLIYYEIECKDNGIGFEQQNAEQVFLIFHRLHARKQFSGTGIGLALCKSIVVNHHGELLAVGVPDGGATFKIILPVSQPKKSG